MAGYYIKFWASWYESISHLPKDKRGDFYVKLFDKVFADPDTEFDTVEGDIIWTMIEPMIEKDIEAYRNGIKGGRPKGSKKGGKNPPKNPSEKGGKNPPKNPPLKGAKNLEKEEEEEKRNLEEEKRSENEELSRERDSRAREEWWAYLKACLDAWNEVFETSMYEFNQEAILFIRKVYDSGRTIEEVRTVYETAKKEWDAKYRTPRAIFKSFEDLLNRQKDDGGNPLLFNSMMGGAA